MSLLVNQKDKTVNVQELVNLLEARNLVGQSSSARFLHNEIKDHVHHPSVERVSKVKLPDVLEF